MSHPIAHSLLALLLAVPSAAGSLAVRPHADDSIVEALVETRAAFLGADKEDDQIKAKLKGIEKYKDRASTYAFEALAGIRTAKAFKAMKRAISWLREEPAMGRAYASLIKFRGVEGVEDKVIDYLAKEAIGRSGRSSCVVAAATLAKFGRDARPAGIALARKAKDRAVRWEAIQPLLTPLSREGGVENLKLILRCVRPAVEDDVEAVNKALNRFKGGEVRDIFLDVLTDRKTDSTLRLILIDRYADDESEEVAEALLDCFSFRQPAVQRRAIEILSGRKGLDKVRVRLWSLVAAKDPQLRLVAIEGLARMSGDDDRWRVKLKTLMNDSEAIDRMGAARALAYRPQTEAADALHSMIEDDDWRVRLEVIRQLTAVRDSRSVAIILARMSEDTGRLRRAMARALRDLTGEDHGNTPGRWNAWWRDVQDGYELPSAEEASAKIAKLAEDRAKGETVATFYGLPVFSDRVAFVFDTSGSMNLSAAGGPPGMQGPRSGNNESAMDVAREQMLELIKRLPNGAYCNIIFFSSDVDPWKRKLTELTDKSRAKALEFIDEKEAVGQTALYDAIIEAFDDDEVDTIYILSDGLPSVGELVDPQAIRDAIAEINTVRQIEIHGVDLSGATLAGMIGRTVPLIRWLAEDSGGRYIAPGSELPEPKGKAPFGGR